jgi:hypothetical protein
MIINSKSLEDAGAVPATSTMNISANQYIYAELPRTPSDGSDNGLQTVIVGYVHDGGDIGSTSTE